MKTNDEQPWLGLSEDMLAERNRMLQLVTVDMEYKTLDFGGSEAVDGDKYWIPMSDLHSVIGLFKWMRHLSEKDWWTADHATMLVERYEYLVRNEVLPARFFPESSDEENPDIAELRARMARAEQAIVSVHERLLALEKAVANG